MFLNVFESWDSAGSGKRTSRTREIKQAGLFTKGIKMTNGALENRRHNQMRKENILNTEN